MTKIYPLVEAIDARPWVVKRGEGSIDPVKRIMKVPLGTTSEDIHVRAHEMGHVKITPRVAAHKQCSKYCVSMDALQVCEDLRVHSYLDHCGVKNSGVFTQEEADTMVVRSREDIRSLAAVLVASTYTADLERAVNSIRKVLEPATVEELLSRVSMIVRRLHAGRKIYRPVGLRNCTIPASRLFDAFWPQERDGKGAANIPIKELTGSEMRSGRSVRWGKLIVHTIPQAEMKPLSRFGLKRTFTDEGSNLRAPYRLPIDGRVFVRKHRAQGGTVLIDASSSMRLTREDLHQILQAAPAATVAVYCGRRREGTLTVVGEKGRLATVDRIMEATRLSGNVVDGPALVWLAKQQGPRLWVSDGYVTGVNDNSCIDLAAEAERLCRKAEIYRVPRASAVAGFLRQQRPR